jgi:hypothetical protein
MIYMTPESWEHVGPHVMRLLDLETELVAEEEQGPALPGAAPRRSVIC